MSEHEHEPTPEPTPEPERAPEQVPAEPGREEQALKDSYRRARCGDGPCRARA